PDRRRDGGAVRGRRCSAVRSRHVQVARSGDDDRGSLPRPEVRRQVGRLGAAGMKAAVVTVSDGVFHGQREDASGEVLATAAAEAGFEIVARTVVPDDTDAIRRAVGDLCDEATALVLVTGGTGFAPRDVTPEALAPLYDRRVPGIDEAMRA